MIDALGLATLIALFWIAVLKEVKFSVKLKLKFLWYYFRILLMCISSMDFHCALWCVFVLFRTMAVLPCVSWKIAILEWR